MEWNADSPSRDDWNDMNMKCYLQTVHVAFRSDGNHGPTWLCPSGQVHVWGAIITHERKSAHIPVSMVLYAPIALLSAVPAYSPNVASISIPTPNVRSGSMNMCLFLYPMPSDVEVYACSLWRSTILIRARENGTKHWSRSIVLHKWCWFLFHRSDVCFLQRLGTQSMIPAGEKR